MLLHPMTENENLHCTFRLLTGQVDARTLQKYEQEAKENNRESWVFAYIMGMVKTKKNKKKIKNHKRQPLNEHN